MSWDWESMGGIWRKMFMEGLHSDAKVTISVLIAICSIGMLVKWSRKREDSLGSSGPGILFVLESILEFYRNKHRLLEHNIEKLQASPTHTVVTGLHIMTANPSNVEHMLKINFENYPKGEFINESLRDMLGNGIFNADDEHWKIQRKVASPEFSTRSLRDLVLESVAKETSRIFPIMADVIDSGEALDLQDIFTRFAIDNICQVALGVDSGCLSQSLPRVQFAVAFDQATSSTLQKFQTFPKVLWYIQRVLNVGHAKELRDAMKVIDEFAMGVIRNRRKEHMMAAASGDEHGGKADLLSRFMTLVDEDVDDEIRGPVSDYERKWTEDRKKGGNEFSDLFLRDIIISFVMAGRDTSTAALAWFFYVLLRHPKVEEAILDEIRSVDSRRSSTEKREKRSSPYSYDELKNMQYLHAALHESIRLYPPVPVNFKTARNADVWPDGTVIRPGTVVAYHPFAMGRMENLWGHDCLEFKPERWLKDNVFVPRSPFIYSAFHAGPRVCLGKDMVLLQMKVICTAIISNFELTLPTDYEARLSSTSLTLRLQDGLPVTVRHRNRASRSETLEET